jgi:glycosyltransferase involved in cell wall biosynthesis
MTGQPATNGAGAVTLSLVINTFNRPAGCAAALTSALANHVDGFEIVVADAGGSSETADALAPFTADPRWRHVRIPDRGLCTSRNLGAEHATGEWIAFLDDDDRVEPDWAATLLSHATDSTAIVSCGCVLVDDDNRETGSKDVHPLGPLFYDVEGLYLAGCFIMRREIFAAIGGYLNALPSSHQTELWLRAIEYVHAADGAWTVAVERRRLTRIHRRTAVARSLLNPSLVHDGTRWILARHTRAFTRSPQDLTDWELEVGVNAVRLGRRRDARRAFLRAIRAKWDPRTAARIVATFSTRACKRFWGDDTAYVDRNIVASQGVSAVKRHRTATEGTPSEDFWFLPPGYRVNPSQLTGTPGESSSSDSAGTPFWGETVGHNDVRYQDPVYRWAARLVKGGATPVIDIGCGSGHKLVHRVGKVTDDYVGVDQPSGIRLATQHFPNSNWIATDLEDPEAWEALAERRPKLVICSDVIEHLTDPGQLLERLHGLAAHGRVLLSTPDRSRIEGAPWLGPPGNPRHIREWTQDELVLLVESEGFRVLERRHFLPRRYSFTRTDFNRTLYRLLKRKPVPDPRYSQALLLEPLPTTSP